MPFDFAEFINHFSGYIGLGAGTAGGGYAYFQSKQNKEDIKNARKDIDKLEADFVEFIVLVAREYASKDDIGEIKAMLRRIEDKMDKKVDK